MNAIVRKAGKAAGPLLRLRHLIVAGSVLLFLILGVAFVLVYQSAGIMHNQINEDFNQQQLVLARHAASHVDAMLQRLVLEVEHLAERPGGASEQAMAGVLTRWEADGLVEIGFVDSSDRLVAGRRADGLPRATPELVRSDCARDDEGRTLLGPVRPEESEASGGIVTALFGKQARYEDGRMGTLFARINVSSVARLATRGIRSGETGYAWVIDSRGTFLAHPLREFVGRSAFEVRHERGPYINFTEIDHIMRDRMLRGTEGTGTYVSGWHRSVEGRMTKLIAFAPVRSAVMSPDHVWSMAVVAPATEVADVVHRVYLRHFAAAAALIAAVFVVGVVGMLYQRRMSRAVERKMGQQEEYVASILQNSVDAILFIDTDNRVQVWNRGAELIFGYTPEEMLGQTFHQLVPPELDADRELRHIQDEALRKGHIRHYVTARLTKDGRRITVDITRTMVQSRDGELVGSTVIIKDVTEARELDQRIYNTEKLASLGNLAAGVAHEINNPLAIILGFTDLLLERFDEGTPEYEDLKIIEENGNQARRTVEKLLGFARVTEGLEDVVDIGGCIRTVADIARNTLMTAKIELAVVLPEALPQVRGDPREFQQVIFNLINNAVAAMQETGGALTLRAAEEEGNVRVSVSDTGPGIPDRIKQRIFDPFFTTKKVGEGTGLGLSLCYGIIKKYGGRIDFTSVSAEDDPHRPSGTTFTVWMPVTRVIGGHNSTSIVSPDYTEETNAEG